MLAVGWVHSIPNSIVTLNQVTIGGYYISDTYPWSTFISMVACLLTFTIEEIIESVGSWRNASSHPIHYNLHHHTSRQPLKWDIEQPSYGTANKEEEIENASEQDANERIIQVVKPLTKMMVLFFGLFFHNIFVGIALGIAYNDVNLFIAITFHQFFEGLGMGARVTMAKLQSLSTTLAVEVLFALAAPIGIGFGLVFKASLTNDSTIYLAFDGFFQGISGGILIYVALSHMIRTYQESTIADGSQTWECHKWASYFGVLCGAAAMSVIGIWA